MYKTFVIIRIKMAFAILGVLEYDDEIKELSFFLWKWHFHKRNFKNKNNLIVTKKSKFRINEMCLTSDNFSSENITSLFYKENKQY